MVLSADIVLAVVALVLGENDGFYWNACVKTVSTEVVSKICGGNEIRSQASQK